MIKGNALHTAKCAIDVAVKTTLNQSVDPVADPTQIGQEGLSFLENVANVAIRKWTVLNTAKSLITQIQTQKKCRI